MTLAFPLAFKLALAAVAARDARALPETVKLDWNAPPECPAREHVLLDVARVLGDSPANRGPLAVRADVARTGSGRWAAVLSVAGPEGRRERHLEAESCGAVASAIALIVAVSIEMDGSPGQKTPPDTLVRAIAAPPGNAPARAWQLVTTVGGLIDGGSLPRLAGGAEVALGLGLAAATWRVRALAGIGYFPGQTVIGARVEEGGRFRLLEGSVRACASITRGRFDAGPCLGAEIATMSAEGVGPETTFEPASASGVWGSVLGGAMASWAFSRQIAVFGRVEGLVSVGQSRFVLMPGRVVVHRSSDVAVRGALGLELRFF